MRREVLRAFKRLHRARQYVFEGDDRALTEGRKLINDKFRENSNVSDTDEIKKLVKLADDVEKELRTNVIQAVRTEEDTYELRIKDDTLRLDNVAFNPDAIIEPPRRGKGGCGNQGANSKKEKQL